MVLDCGDGVCHCSPVFEGFSINSAVQRIDIGGRDVTEHLMTLLRRSGYVFHTTAEFEIVKKIKEKYCYINSITSSSNDDFKGADEKNTTNYILPDGNIMKIASEKH